MSSDRAGTDGECPEGSCDGGSNRPGTESLGKRSAATEARDVNGEDPSCLRDARRYRSPEVEGVAEAVQQEKGPRSAVVWPQGLGKVPECLVHGV